MQQKTLSQLFDDWNNGDKTALDELITLFQAELHLCAVQLMNKDRKNHTLQATVLINEIYIALTHQKPVPMKTKEDFLGLMQKKMHDYLISYARQWSAKKRDGKQKVQLYLDITGNIYAPPYTTNLDILEPLLEKLAIDISPLCVDIFNDQYEEKLEISRIAEKRGLSIRQVKHLLFTARKYLANKLGDMHEPN